MRLLIMHAAPEGCVIEDGEVKIVVSGLVMDYDRLKSLTDIACHIAEGLAADERTIIERLAHNALNDSYLSFRIQCFEFLCERDSSRRHVEAVAEEFTRSEHPSLRISGARVLGDSAHGVLTGLAADSTVPENLRASALDALTHVDKSVSEVNAQILALFADPELSVWSEHLPSLLRVASHRGVRLSYEILDRFRHSENRIVLEAVARAYELVEDPRAEAVLLEILKHDGDTIAAAAAYSLATIGTVKAVQPLMDRSSGLMKLAVLKENARAAIEHIQRHVGKQARGGLALSEENRGGELSQVEEDVE